MGRRRQDWLDRLDRAAGRYEQSVRAGRSPGRVDGDLGLQAELYRDAAARRQMRAAQVRELLRRADVPQMWFVPYCNFAQHIDRVGRNHTGKTRAALVEAAVERWTLQGLDEGVLRLILAVMEDPGVHPDDVSL
jgi:hypothetical protein